MKALVSVHDLTPANIPQVLRILGLLEEARVPPVTLLVVPGKEWGREDLAFLREMERKGHPLAGHGWIHQANPPRTLFHRIHGLLISRDQGEHLSRSRAELLGLVRKSFHWFSQVGLRPPELYVPPAWTMGALRRRDLVELPFLGYEVLRGLVDGRTGRLNLLPLIGFEADTSIRKLGLRVFNGANRELGRATGLPIRISVHPADLDLLLGADLERMVREPWEYVREATLLGPKAVP